MAKPTILVAEDDAASAIMILDFLQRVGYRVAHVDNGLQALQLLGSELDDEQAAAARAMNWTFPEEGISVELAGKPDLILTDCMMPQVDGLTLATALSRQDAFAKLPVVVLTSKLGMEEPFRQLPNVKGFFVKGSPLSKLRDAVAKLAAPQPDDHQAYDHNDV